MARSALRSGWLLLAILFSCAWQAAAAPPSESLLPATTKAFVSTPNVDTLRTKFDATQLGQLVNDPLMRPFVEDLRQQLKQKLADAGKSLGISWADLEGVYAGEVALAAIQPDSKNKLSHATALFVDITGKRTEADGLLTKIAQNQAAKGAVRSARKAQGVDMIVYTQPKQPDQEAPEQAFYFIKDEVFIVADHPQVADDIAGRFGAGVGSLATVPAFKYAMERNSKEAAGLAPNIRWFIEPFGYTEVYRAQNGGRKRRGTDPLKILAGQGFTAVQGLGGYVFLNTDHEEILHRTYVYAPGKGGVEPKDRFELASRMLDFPNSASAGQLAPQSFAPEGVASYLTFNFKLREAFEYSASLVDAFAGEKGVFEEVLASLKSDPAGPRIDVRKELIDHLQERATLMTDYRLPIDTKSERWLAAIELKSTSSAVVAKTLEKAFKNDPNAKKRTYEGTVIWEISNEEESVEQGLTLNVEGPGFVNTENQAAEDEEEGDQTLPNSALTVAHGHLLVASHVDFIVDLLKKPAAAPLGQLQAQQRVEEALTRLGSDKDSFRFFTRTDESYRPTYELVRMNKMPEAETMLAKALNASMGSGKKGDVRKREIDGSKLPEFELIRKYLGPAGLYGKTEAQGWYFCGCLLKKE